MARKKLTMHEIKDILRLRAEPVLSCRSSCCQNHCMILFFLIDEMNSLFEAVKPDPKGDMLQIATLHIRLIVKGPQVQLQASYRYRKTIDGGIQQQQVATTI